MKVMIVAPYIYDSDRPEFTRNKTGFGIMVRNIALSISKITDVSIVTRVVTRGDNSDKNYYIVPHTWQMIVKNATVRDWIKGIQCFILRNKHFKERARQAFYTIDSGYFRKKIQEEKPDIVHIHGIGTITETYIDICEEIGIKYAVTLHGLIGLDDSISVANHERKMEYKFIKKAAEKNVPVSVISTGMKKRIEKFYLHKTSTNITVILNGTNNKNDKYIYENKRNKSSITDYMNEYRKILKNENRYPDIYSTYNFLDINKKRGKKIVYFVGNITPNKNQKQAIEVMRNEEFFKDTLLVLWGKEVDEGYVRSKIIEYQLENRVILGGFNRYLEEFWDLCDVNLFLSLNDGFGLPIIEGYMHGIPCVTFDDLDATEDLYCSDAMLKIQDRNISTINSALYDALKKEWNSSQIIKFGHHFSVETMAKSYVNWYKSIIG